MITSKPTVQIPIELFASSISGTPPLYLFLASLCSKRYEPPYPNPRTTCNPNTDVHTSSLPISRTPHHRTSHQPRIQRISGTAHPCFRAELRHLVPSPIPITTAPRVVSDSSLCVVQNPKSPDIGHKLEKKNESQPPGTSFLARFMAGARVLVSQRETFRRSWETVSLS
jgi:hypothetical protein